MSQYDAAMDEIAEQDEELEMEKYNDQQWQEYCDDVDLREMCTKSVDDRRSSMDLVGSSLDNALRALSKDEPPILFSLTSMTQKKNTTSCHRPLIHNFLWVGSFCPTCQSMFCEWNHWIL